MAFRIPLSGNYRISQGFGGNAAYYKQFGQVGHNGVDYAVPTGTPVYAADEGTVTFEGWGQNHSWMGVPAGICVLINHIGSYAGYAHLSRTVVNKGQRVKKGQVIGYVGATGAATGPHLHFEMLPLKPNFNNGFAGRINAAPFMEKATKNATQAEIKKAYKDILERDADAAGLRHYANYPLSFVRDDLMKSQERRKLEANKAAAAKAAAEKKAVDAKKAADRKKAEEAARKAQEEADRIAAEEAAAKKEAEEAAESQSNLAKENNRLLQQILSLLTDLVNKFTNIFK